MTARAAVVPFVLLVGAHAWAAWLLVFRFSWSGLALAVGLHYLVAGLGISVTYHRVLSHRAAKLWWPLEYLFATFGSMALHGDPVRWVTIHRQHHRFADRPGDPHSPREGFWYAHATWTRHRFLADSAPEKVRRYAPELDDQRFYRWTRDKVWLRILVQVVPLYLWGGDHAVAWGFGFRYVLTSTAIWSVNSVTHGWGFRAFARDDMSTNHLPVALLSFGEGWHNNHHAFPTSARFGLAPWQLDVGWLSLRALAAVGLARDLRLPGAAARNQAGPASLGEWLGVARPRLRGYRART